LDHEVQDLQLNIGKRLDLPGGSRSLALRYRFGPWQRGRLEGGHVCSRTGYERYPNAPLRRVSRKPLVLIVYSVIRP
jgi:hypothetical protein